ncbi:MAG: primary-amine oxidase, partial [Planctomycetia bacterium]|nr:primary-amine oxidase [Planctomycetia bacterium]
MSHPDSASTGKSFLSRRRFLETSAVLAGGLGLADAATSEAAQQKPAAPPAAKSTTPTKPAHPLDPLTPDEIVRAVEIVRKTKNVDDTWRFVTVTLAEPNKQTVKTFKPNSPVPRNAFVIVIDRAKGQAYEGIVELVKGALDRFDPLPTGLQPAITLDEFSECEEAIKRSPDFLAALKKRGATDVQLVMVDPWSAGMYGAERPEDQGKRLSRALAWVRSEASDNGYARPLDGVVAVVDLNKMQVVRVEDFGVIPMPPEAGNWHRSYVKELREAPRHLAITQSEGPTFAVDGYEVAWQKWKFRIGFTPREGLVLHNITYTDAGRERPIIYRAGICEMVVPYGDPAERHYRKNAFDIGEYGIGMFANSLELGCDCLGTIRYFDARMNDSRGQPVTIKNAICLHEEDAGLLWKHTDWRTNQSETRRSRRLAVSFVATVGNYEYGFFWYLYQDGNIQCEVKLTGIMHTTTAAPGEKPAFGTLVAPQLNAPFHEHLFAARLDLAVDGEENSIYEVNTASLPSGENNPYGNAFRAEHTLLAKESQAKRSVNGASARYWRIVNPNKSNRLGEPVAYRLIPGENAPPFVRPDAAVMRRAGFIAHQLWVTPFDPKERYAAGD